HRTLVVATILTVLGVSMILSVTGTDLVIAAYFVGLALAMSCMFMTASLVMPIMGHLLEPANNQNNPSTVAMDAGRFSSVGGKVQQRLALALLAILLVVGVGYTLRIKHWSEGISMSAISVALVLGSALFPVAQVLAAPFVAFRDALDARQRVADLV